jgi:hypothetical protein
VLVHLPILTFISIFTKGYKSYVAETTALIKNHGILTTCNRFRCTVATTYEILGFFKNTIGNSIVDDGTSLIYLIHGFKVFFHNR